MNVRALSPEQLMELKQAYVCETVKAPSWGDLADANDIPDEIIFEHFAGTEFFDGGFWCTA